MKFDLRNPPRGVVVFLIAVFAIGIGFLGDFLISTVECRAYPQKYESHVTVYADRYGLPEHLLYSLIKCESDFDSGAVSSAGAVGLTQIMPETFTWLTNDILLEHLDEGMLYDPETNIRYGAAYLSRLYDKYGDWTLALCAYNAGPGRVDEWLEDPSLADGEGGLKKIPFKETRRYVKRVKRAWGIYDRLYGEEKPSETLSPAS